ncbi:hypothetical protein [Streptomyces sp. GC420]|uniref:hypothetical protein n=1 Tax=Streptomyces sp. GC420 TaxID=2697568 RepID=UPI001414FD89|nr:hypothetical protein [Streptomyces sp. GC420]NBM15002.1 hypothetical protein [Streptomyces sp. GC420]
MADFTNMRKITSVEQLTPAQVEQLGLCGVAYDGEDLPAAERVSSSEVADEEGVLHFCELWDVVIDGSVVYEAWFYQVDSGSIFKANTIEMVAEVIQCGLECGDEEAELEIGMGMVKSGLLPSRDSEYERFSHALNGAASQQ